MHIYVTQDIYIIVFICDFGHVVHVHLESAIDI